MVNVVYHKDGTPQCSQCNTGYEDAEGAEYCCTSCVDCGFRQHGMHERAQQCCPCLCEPSWPCECSENGDCCQDYVGFEGESDDYSVYLKVWLDNDNYDSPLFGVFDTEKKAKAARWHNRNDNVRVFDIIKISRKGGKAVFGAEDEYIRCDWCNKGIGTLEDLESGSVEYLGDGGDIVCMTCVTKRGIPYDVSHAEWHHSNIYWNASCESCYWENRFISTELGDLPSVCPSCKKAVTIVAVDSENNLIPMNSEWHHSNTTCHECGSDDVDYTKVYYCSQCGEDDLVPGEQCSCGNLVGSKDYFEQMICGDCDNAWIEDDYSAEFFEAPRKSVSVSRRKKNNKISKTISDIMHSWEKTGMIGKNRPRSRKSAQKMAIAVAYSINNRKTTKKAEEGNTPVMPPMDFGEMANWRPLDGTPGLKRKRAENYKHECITCAKGMDELVAKGQTWSCECCGFLVGTQGKHEGCGYNDNGEVMCNLCATEQCDCASFSAEMSKEVYNALDTTKMPYSCCGEEMPWFDTDGSRYYWHCYVCEKDYDTDEFGNIKKE